MPCKLLFNSGQQCTLWLNFLQLGMKIKLNSPPKSPGEYNMQKHAVSLCFLLATLRSPPQKLLKMPTQVFCPKVVWRHKACRAIGTHSRQPVTSCFPFPILLILLFICCLHLLIVPNVYRTIKQYPTFTSFLHSPSATIYVCFLQAAQVLEREKYIFPHINPNHSFPSPLESGFFLAHPII